MQAIISFNAIAIPAGQGQIKTAPQGSAKAQASYPHRSAAAAFLSGVQRVKHCGLTSKSLIALRPRPAPKGYDAVAVRGKRLPPQPPTQRTIGEIYRWIDRTPDSNTPLGVSVHTCHRAQPWCGQAGPQQNPTVYAKAADGLADILLADAAVRCPSRRARIHKPHTALWKPLRRNLGRVFPLLGGASYYSRYAGK